MYTQSKKRNLKAFALAEILLSIGILSVVILGLAGSLAYSIQTSSSVSKKNKALFLVDEGVEAVRAIRDESYTALTNGNHGVSSSSSTWSFSGTSDTTDEFSRVIGISDVTPTIKQVTVTVSWNGLPLGTNQVSTTIRLSNWLRSVTLGGDWSNAVIRNSDDITGTSNGIGVNYDPSGYLYLLRQSGTSTLRAYDASNLDSLVTLSTINVSDTMYALERAGNYLYLATSNNTQEVKIYNYTNKLAPFQSGSINFTGSGDARTLLVQGNYLYVGLTSDVLSSEFYIHNISTPATPVFLGEVNLNQTVYSIAVSGNYAFLATSDNTFETRVINITNPAAPVVLTGYGLSGNNDMGGVAVYGTNLYVGRQADGYFVSYDITNILAPITLDTYTIGDDIRDIVLNSDGSIAFVGTDLTTELYIFDISDPSNITVLDTISINDDINDLQYDSLSDNVFGATDDNNRELVIFEGS